MTELNRLLTLIYTDQLDVFKGELNSDKTGIDSVDQDGRTLLTNSIIDRKLEFAKLLIDVGANINQSDNEDWTALHFAAQNLDDEAIKLLISKGAEIDAIDVHGNTPLWRATFVTETNGSAIKLLLSYGANPRKKNHHDLSPLDLANNLQGNIERFFNCESNNLAHDN